MTEINIYESEVLELRKVCAYIKSISEKNLHQFYGNESYYVTEDACSIEIYGKKRKISFD